MSGSPRARASIVVLAWRNADHLPACLASLRQNIARDTAHEIVVVLNGASEDVVTLVEDAGDVRVVRSRVNRGFSGGCHLGAAAATGEYLVFLNDDTIVEPGWLEALIETAEAHPNAAAVGSQILYLDGTLQEAGSLVFADGSTTAVGRLAGVHPAAFDFVRRVDYCSGCSLLVRRSAWDDLGGFHEEYFPAYYEDTDFCLSASAKGYDVIYDPRSRVRHVESASSTPDGKVFLLLRSREEFLRRWRHALDVFEPAQPESGPAIVRAIWRARGLPPRVLIVDDRLTAPSFGSGVGRLRSMIAGLGRSHALTFSPSDSSFDVDREFLRRHGAGLVDDDLEGYLARPEVQFDVAILSRPNNFERWADVLRRLQPQAAIIYDAEALYWRRVARRAAIAADRAEQRALHHEWTRLASLEQRIARQADVVVAVSPSEARWFALQRGSQVGVFCPAPRIASRAEAGAVGVPAGAKPHGLRTDLLFVAGWLGVVDSPNRDGLDWFLRDVFPAIRSVLPQIRLKITGSAADAGPLARRSGALDFLGTVDDLTAVYGSSLVVIAPVRFGAGVKIKVIEAIEHHVPVVTTSVGIEGIRGGPSTALVADRPDRFARAVVSLVRDPLLWQRCQEAASALTREWDRRCDPDWPDIVAFARRRLTTAQIARRLREGTGLSQPATAAGG